MGGTVAPVNSWPWQVMVTDEYGSQFCGGSLVDPYWVVTAAHCLDGGTPSGVKIRFISRVVQYTRTDTTRIIACYFMHDPFYSYGSLNNGLRVVQFVNCIS